MPGTSPCSDALSSATGECGVVNVVAVRVADRGGAVPRPGLGEDPADVGLDRVVAQEQLRGDLRIGHPAGDHAQDLRFALRQAVGRRRAPGGLGLRGGFRGGEQRRVHAGVEDRQPAYRRAQRPGDLGVVGVLGEVAARAGPERVQDRAVVRVCAEHDDRDLGVLGGQPADGADAVQDGHVQVEQDRVGVVLGHEVQGLLPVRGGADHLDVGYRVEQQDEALAHAGLIIGDDEAQRCPRRRGGHEAMVSGWRRGSSAVTIHWPSRRPASRVPFSSRSRSCMPVSP